MDSIGKIFCGLDSFQLLDYTFNSTFPHFTRCSQESVLTLIPCVFLFLFAPLVLHSIYTSDNGSLEVFSPISARILISVLLSCYAGYQLFFGIVGGQNGEFNFMVLVPRILQYLALCSVLVMLVACKKRGVITSGVLFNFWFLMAVCKFPEFRWRVSSFLDSEEFDDWLSFSLFILFYVLILLELLLSCFADTPVYKISGEKICPEEYCSFLNQITFSWFNKLAIKGSKRPLQVLDLWKLKSRDESAVLVPHFNAHLQPALKAYSERKNAANASLLEVEKDKGLPSVIWSLFKTFKWSFFGGMFLKLVFDLLQFVSPQLLKMLISFIEDKRSPMWIGVSISLTMFFVALFQSFVLHQYFHIMFTAGMNIRSVLTSAIYTKALCLSNSARKNRTVGEIVNLMSVDTQRFQDMASFIMLFWSAPLQVILSVYFLWRLLGISVFAGIFVLTGMIPLNALLACKMRNAQVEQMKYKDERLKLMSEILNGMKVLKFYAWENSMKKMILAIRQKELKVLRRLAYYNAAITLSWSCAPFLVTVVTFGVYVNISSSNILTPQVTFVGLALFNILRFPMAVFSMLFGQAVQCAVSNRRVKSFLADDEIENFVLEGNSSSSAMSIQNGDFSWDNGELTLKNINLNIKPGQLVAVVGSVGSGKSSLLSALLGEMDKRRGEVCVSGSVSYVPQQAWLQNMSLKENITFGAPYMQENYEKIVEACALKPDIAMLPAGDETEIGEKGINLSGGQKQRISLARAVYADADIVLLDDPLSAVDAHVGKHIFEKIISSKTGLLAKKTRILVTHVLHYLKFCDQIIVMKDGTISERGTYEELISAEGAFSEFLEEYLVEEAKNRGRSISFGEQEEDVNEVLKDLERFHPGKRRNVERHISQESLEQKSMKSVCNKSFGMTVPAISNTVKTDEEVKHKLDGGNKFEMEPLIKKEKSGAAPPSNNEKSKLIEKETVEIGRVKWSVYMAYIKAIGYPITCLFVFIYILSSILGVLSNLWLADWSDHAKQRNSSAEDDDTNMRLVVYAGLGVGQAAFICAASVAMALGMVYASRILHEGILSNILHSPMVFFDVTPLGRILNRFGKDLDTVDSRLPGALISTVAYYVYGFFTAFIPVIVTPPVLFVFIGISTVYYFLMRFYVSTSRQLKRLESTSRSPIYSHFQESIQGAACIRAYHRVDRFIKESQKRVDNNLAIYYPSIVANRWLAVRLELIGNLIVAFSALFAVFYRDSRGVTAGLAGLSVSYALNITQTLNWAVRMTSELETNIVAVERLKEYTESPTEGLKDQLCQKKPSHDWPSKGEIVIKNLYLRYRQNLDYVLKGISAHILPNEKVGVVGRTGAGKSSLMIALFRIVEADSGSVEIDGEDIANLPLEYLRAKLTIVPQDPVLFSGTLRMNLDPFEVSSDGQIWEALKMAHLEPFIVSLPDRLEHFITEGGQNLSVGQRQLICLARALLRKTKILILDEAAASVDMETDALIQKTIREQFSDCTVLTIAHRLQTVIDLDRLIVMDNGIIKEFDTPKKLLSNKSSLFYSMAKDAGIAD